MVPMVPVVLVVRGEEGEGEVCRRRGEACPV